MSGDPLVILTRESADNLLPTVRLTQMMPHLRILDYPCITTSLLPFGEVSFLPEGKRISDFDAVVFTSKRGVAGMAAAFADQGFDRLLLAAVGSATAAAVKKACGREPDLTASPATSEALALMLVKRLAYDSNGTTPPPEILHVRGNKSTGSFKRIIIDNGFQHTELTVYQNQDAELQALETMKGLFPAPLVLTVFASPSAAGNFFTRNSRFLDTAPAQHLAYLAIGPTTAAFLKRLDLPEVFEASNQSVDGLTDKICEVLKRYSPLKVPAGTDVV